MKLLIILGISFYQLFISRFIKQLLGVSKMCRFSPTCSEYSKMVIQKHGLRKGLGMSLVRISSCRSF